MDTNYNDIVKYFDEKVVAFGSGPNAVDWNSTEAQEIRFFQLSKVLPNEGNEFFTICDFGCGLGALSDYLQKKYTTFRYTGVDVSQKMIGAAKKQHKFKENIGEFVCAHEVEDDYDYIVESGIFNARNDVSNERWLEYIIKTLKMFHEHSRKGFAFNCLTKYSDEERMKEYLYYADPCYLFDHCKRHYSRNVALLHDYDIYDFTILVRK